MSDMIQQRASSPQLDALLGCKMKVGTHGFVRVVDYMGNQSSIVQAARVSYGEGTKTVQSDRGLIRYLMRHRHTSPFEMCEIKLHVKLPIFVARQWIRHRTASVNEVSARYSILAAEFYMPETWYAQSADNKQGSGDPLSADMQPVMDSLASEAYALAEDAYNVMLQEAPGCPPTAREQARILLPLSTYTEMYWKIDLHNLLHFLALRKHPHAQQEIREYADTILDVLRLWMPDVVRAWHDYIFDAHTFSRQEMDILRALLADRHHTLPDQIGGESAREVAAFKQALTVGY